jgi:glycosyltransferase involved in cell wall biosynthesis
VGNRTENLLKALPTWIARPEIDEIIIVDWHSDVPVADEIADAELSDPRLRTVRFDTDEGWRLPTAFNVGLRLARFDRILKIDGDILLKDAFFDHHKPKPGLFVAGNYRILKKDEIHINGTVFLHRSDLAKVGGINEFKVGYGWEDDDFYERLTRTGAGRQDLDPKLVFHVPHGDETRVPPATTPSARDEMLSRPNFSIRRNRYIMEFMPDWNGKRKMPPYRLEVGTNGRETVSRDGPDDTGVPPFVFARATDMCLRIYMSHRLGQDVLGLDEDHLAPLLDKPWEDLGPEDVAAALAAQAAAGGPAPSPTARL